MVKIQTVKGEVYHVTTVRISAEAYHLSKFCKKSMSKMLEEAILENAEVSTK